MTWLRSTSDMLTKQRVEGGDGEYNEGKTRWTKMGKDELENSLEELSNKL